MVMTHLPFVPKTDETVADPRSGPKPHDSLPPDHHPLAAQPTNHRGVTDADDDNPLAASGPPDLAGLQMFVDQDFQQPHVDAPKIFDPKAQAAVTEFMALSRNVQLHAQNAQNAHLQSVIRASMNEPFSSALTARLVKASQNMDAAKGKELIQILDSIDDANLREQVRKKFHGSTNQDLTSFIEKSHGWNNDGPERDRSAAARLIDPERDRANEAIRAMPPALREIEQAKADAYASQILAATYSHDHDAANQQKILRALQGRTAVEIEMIRAAVRKQTHGESNLYQAIDNGMRGGHEDAAVAMLDGDRIKSVEAVFLNELDPARRREAVMGLLPEERKQLDKTSLKYVMDPADRAELEALIAGDTNRANAERLGNLLQDQKSNKSGLAFEADFVAQENYKRRASSNVMKEFESMSGEEVRAAAEEWNKHHSQSFESMIAERWEDAEDKSQHARLLAMVRGDKAKNRALRFQAGVTRDDQAMIEAALAHDVPTSDQLSSKDDAVRSKALATMQENAFFELYNVEHDQTTQRLSSIVAGRGDDRSATGRSTAKQLEEHFKTHQNQDLQASIAGFALGSGAEDAIRASDLRKDKVGTNELYIDGHLSTASEVRRAKGDAAKSDVMEGIDTQAGLDALRADYRHKFLEDMYSVSEDDREDMSAAELRKDNLRLYGPVGARPAQLEYLLQAQQYTQSHSDWLEDDDEDEAGGGTQTWQRQLLAAQRDLLQDKTLGVSAPTKVEGHMGYRMYLDQSPTFAQMETRLAKLHATPNLGDGLASGASRQDFQALDRGMTLANQAQGDAKQRLADRVTTMIANVAKIASMLAANPALALAFDLAKGTLDMAVKEAIMGESYDPSLDAKVLLYTALADAALLGASEAGKRGLGGLGQAKWDLLGKGTKTAIKTTGEAYKDNQSPVELLRSLVAEGINLKLPDHLSDQVKTALAANDEKLAELILSKIAESGVGIAVGTATQASVGGQDTTDALAGEGYDASKGLMKDALLYKPGKTR